MKEVRIEHDTMGEIAVPAEHCWGAQTQRSLENFSIGTEKISSEIILSLVLIKYCAAQVNEEKGKLSHVQAQAIKKACMKLLKEDYYSEFPLKVWQTGSGTQTNMNVNEVISYIANTSEKVPFIHPNDHVNMSQSSNDVFPTAMHIAAVCEIENSLFPSIEKLIQTLEKKEEQYKNLIKIGRTHLQDAVPITFGQEIRGWKGMIQESYEMIKKAVPFLRKLAIGGTAVGTGLNAPLNFDKSMAEKISEMTGNKFVSNVNKFHALSSKDSYVFMHGALKTLAADLLKIANDIRWLASGPRCGLGEISIPENEPGSSIMPGKVNPTQCEAITMIAVQIMGNDVTVGLAASQGNFELNVFMPVLAYNMMQTIRLLTDGISCFEEKCIRGIVPVENQMTNNVEKSLMLVTCLSPIIGYENAAKAAKLAFRENKTLREAVVSLGYLKETEYNKIVSPEKMV